MILNDKELRVLNDFIDRLGRYFSNAGCNDWDFPADWTSEERHAAVKQYEELNGTPEDYDPNREPMLMDFSMLYLLKWKLNQ